MHLLETSTKAKLLNHIYRAHQRYNPIDDLIIPSSPRRDV